MTAAKAKDPGARRAKFIHAQVDVELRDHERITGADLGDLPEGMQPIMRLAMLGLFTWCLLYKQAKRSKDALIAMSTVHGACGGGQGPVAARLVSCGLLLVTRDGYTIHRYLEKNWAWEKRDTEAERNRDRQRRHREKKLNPAPLPEEKVTRDNAVTPFSFSLSLSSSDSPEATTDQNATPADPPEPTPPPSSGVRAVDDPPPPKRPPGGVSDWDIRARERYVDGIRIGARVGYVWPDGYGDQGRLNGAVLEFAKYQDGRPMRGDDVGDWIEAAASDFARDILRSGKSEYGFTLKHFVAWLTRDATRQRELEGARACP